MNYSGTPAFQKFPDSSADLLAVKLPACRSALFNPSEFAKKKA